MAKVLEKRPGLGLLYGISAFLFWGSIPLYWKQVDQVPSLELLGHRILWGSIILLPIVFISSSAQDVFSIFKKADRWLVFSTLTVFLNWGIFVWAVNHDHIIDASLGYYLTPLLNIITGIIFFKERAEKLKIIAFLFALVGVGSLFISNSGRAEISLSLAISFSFYGYLKKKSHLRSESALLFEIFFWLIPTIIYFVYLHSQQEFVFAREMPMDKGLIFLAGIVTIFPLWCFNNAVKHVDLGTVGFLHYLTPTLQLIIGAYLYGEILDQGRIVAFSLIWTGIIIYLLSKLNRNEKVQRTNT